MWGFGLLWFGLEMRRGVGLLVRLVGFSSEIGSAAVWKLVWRFIVEVVIQPTKHGESPIEI